jgi:probable phosphoglycerate mutase
MAEPRSFPQRPYEAPPGSTELVLVRHGASEAFVEGEDFPMTEGHGDPPLADEGRVQAERVCRRLAGERVDALYVTTLRRTVETAAPLAALLGIEPVVEPDLREVFLGEWEGGLLRAKFADGDPLALRSLQEQRWDVIPGAEPNEDFTARVRGAVDRLVSMHPDERVVVVSHGATIGEICRQATGAEPFAFVAPDNASISHLLVADGRWRLRRFNDTSHLC